MSLFLFGDPFEYSRPSRILDQHFGLGLDPEDLLAPLVPREVRTLSRCPTGYLRPWRTSASQRDSGSTVNFDKDKFQANLDVQQFKPEEITVKVNDNIITVEGKHEEKEDEHGYISRHFVRRYALPKGHDIAKVESKLSSDGVLTITAPKIAIDKEESKSIPVIQTGQPSKPIEQKKEMKKNRSVVCSKHFTREDYLTTAEVNRRQYLKKNAVPSQNVCVANSDQKKEARRAITRRKAMSDRDSPSRKKIKVEIASSGESDAGNISPHGEAKIDASFIKQETEEIKSELAEDIKSEIAEEINLEQIKTELQEEEVIIKDEIIEQVEEESEASSSSSSTQSGPPVKKKSCTVQSKKLQNIGVKPELLKSHIFQFKVTLLRGKAMKIWRRIQVPGDYTFRQFHIAIQKAMGWKSVEYDYHLHAFNIRNPKTDKNDSIVTADDVQHLCQFNEGEVKNEQTTYILDYFTKLGHFAMYEYDFGMGWEHEVVLEKVVPPEVGAKYPKCLAGKKACPPEDGVVHSDEEYDSDEFDADLCFA